MALAVAAISTTPVYSVSSPWWSLPDRAPNGTRADGPGGAGGGVARPEGAAAVAAVEGVAEGGGRELYTKLHDRLLRGYIMDVLGTRTRTAAVAEARAQQLLNRVQSSFASNHRRWGRARTRCCLAP